MYRFLQVILLVVCLTTAVVAEVPHTILYQGRLTDNGIPVNGLKSVRFKIYDRSSNPIWNSGTVNVTFTDGLFTIELGQSPQPSLPLEIWPADTAMSLGVTIETNPELTPRLHFKTVPYAMHALTAGHANSGGGWWHENGLLSLEDPNDSIGIGTSTPEAKVGISSSSDQPVFRVYSDGPLRPFSSPTMELLSLNNTGLILRRGYSWMRPAYPLPALYAVSTVEEGVAGWIESYSSLNSTILVKAEGTGGAISVSSYGGYGLDTWYGKGIRAVADSATAIRAESNCGGATATVLSSAYTGTASYDHIAVSGYSRPADFYGIGGKFEGGYIGAEGNVNPDPGETHFYYGVRGQVNGGAGYSYGLAGYATGAGINFGLYASATNGTTNWAGYFEGNVNVTGSVTKAASTLAIDDPIDPENSVLQQAEVVSDNFKAVYDGIVTLDASGAAAIQLPKYVESFCGDFRYQLTCVGGYAPVYVSSEISGNQFSIAGGQPGLKVSWQITGIRKDKYAQANPLEVEKKKLASQQGKYLHPELFGYSADRSLSPNSDRDPSVKAKNDAIRTATAALAKPSTPPKQPVMMEKK
jgi:hypothetical protein